jgi:hypothetical protein
LTGAVHASIEERHRSREFPAKARLRRSASNRDQAPSNNHSAHISKETIGWPAAQSEGRFTFVFTTPKHGSWLNLVEGFFSKMDRSVLRHIRVVPNRSSRIESWPQSMTSIATRSSAPGL